MGGIQSVVKDVSQEALCSFRQLLVPQFDLITCRRCLRSSLVFGCIFICVPCCCCYGSFLFIRYVVFYYTSRRVRRDSCDEIKVDERDDQATVLGATSERDRNDKEGEEEEEEEEGEEYRAAVKYNPTMVKKNRNYLFYTNQIPSVPRGDFIDNIHKKWINNYTLLEEHHGFIQWLFPLLERGVNWEADPLNDDEIKLILSSVDARERLLKSYKLMLRFYGLMLTDDKAGSVERAQNWEQRYKNLNRNTHNNLRVTRIIKCLKIFEFDYLIRPLLTFLTTEIIVNNRLENCKDSCLHFWLKILPVEEEQELLRSVEQELQRKVEEKTDKKEDTEKFSQSESSAAISISRPTEHHSMCGSSQQIDVQRPVEYGGEEIIKEVPSGAMSRASTSISTYKTVEDETEKSCLINEQ